MNHANFLNLRGPVFQFHYPQNASQAVSGFSYNFSIRRYCRKSQKAANKCRIKQAVLSTDCRAFDCYYCLNLFLYFHLLHSLQLFIFKHILTLPPSSVNRGGFIYSKILLPVNWAFTFLHATKSKDLSAASISTPARIFKFIAAVTARAEKIAKTLKFLPTAQFMTPQICRFSRLSFAFWQ